MAEQMYRQIAEDLQRRIESGELARGAQLPTEIDLREHYDVSRNTIRDAIKWLISRGLIETRPGQGTFAVERIGPLVTTLSADPVTGRGGGEEGVYLAEVQASRREPTNSVPRVEIQKADRPIATSLRIEEGAHVIIRHQQRFIDGTPWSLQATFYPMALMERGAHELIRAADIYGGTIAYLAEKCGIEQAGYRDTISVRPPDEDEARFFKLPADGRVPVFEVWRVGFDEDGNRFRLTVTVYPADRNRLRFDVGALPRGATPPSMNTAIRKAEVG
jgi:GntR family transcriptional regulator